MDKAWIRILYQTCRILAIYFLLIELNFLWLFGYSPGIMELKNPSYTVASEVYASDGSLLGRYYKENRSPIKYEEIPQNLIDALIATEDIRFYQHHGIDFQSLLSSVYSTATGDKRGASTITQQLAKNLF